MYASSALVWYLLQLIGFKIHKYGVFVIDQGARDFIVGAVR